MSIESAFYLQLTSDAGFTALVGARLFPGYNEKPDGQIYAVYQTLFNDRPADISNNPSKRSAQFQLDIYADQLSDAILASDAAIAALNYQGGVIDGVNVQLFRIDRESGIFEDSTKSHRRLIEITAFFD